MNKPAPTRIPIHELLAQRWSPRAFDPERDLSRETIITLLEAAHWAPSCFNDQPWRYLVCHKPDQPAAWQQLFQCLTDKNRLWAQHAPLLLAACSGRQFQHNGKANRWGQYDTGAASLSLCLQATALGLQAHQMGGFDAQQVREAFSIPAEFECMAVIAVGYPGRLDLLHRDFLEAEQGPRSRAEFGTRFFEAQWGQALD